MFLKLRWTDMRTEISLKQLLIFIIALVFLGCTMEDEPDWNNPFIPIDGPAMLLNPLEIHTSINTSFSINLRLEDVKDVMGVYAEMIYDTTVLVFKSYQVLDSKGSLLKSTGGEVVSFVDEDSESGTIIANIGIAVGNPRGIEGSGDILRLEFHFLKSQETEISLSPDCRLTNSDLNDIPIFQLIGGKIYVE